MKQSNHLLRIGFFITFAFIGVVTILALQPYCEGSQDCTTNFVEFMQSPPNEKGDTLAGLAGTLAFLWIIITVALQSNELSLQRDELERTRTTLEKQTSFLASQEAERASLAVDREIETKLETLKRQIREPDFESLDALELESNILRKKYMSWISNKKRTLDLSPPELSSSLEALVKNIRQKRKDGFYIIKPNLKNWEQIKRVSKEILDLSGAATPAMRDRIDHIENIPRLNSAVEQALSEGLWAVPEKDHRS